MILDDKKINKDEEIFPLSEADLNAREAKELDTYVEANSIIFQRNQPDGHTRLLWTL